ncbi:DUF4329 domain-containing protein [Pseudomonas fluorescens]|nr:DUF4329 domain-containing protein [Pseudomonas fluorescens]
MAGVLAPPSKKRVMGILGVFNFKEEIMERYLSRQERAAGPESDAVLPPLSPAFISEDDAARYAHERIGSKRDVEYGSVILRRLSDNRFFATEPITGKSKTFNWLSILKRESTGDFAHPDGYRIVGSLHSHPEAFDYTKQLNPTWSDQQIKAFMSFYSVPDISFNYAERSTFASAYLSGPDGALLKYKPSGTEAERQYVHWLDTSGPWESPHAHDGTVEGVFKKTASVGELSFLVSSETWGGSVGTVPTDWVPFETFESPRNQPACSPVFDDANAALDHAQTRMRRMPDSRQVVFILKGVAKDEYVSTEPVITTQPLYAPEVLFAKRPDGRPKLPSNFRIEGIYYSSQPDPAQLPAKEAWLYKNFFSPAELATAITQSRTDTYLQDSQRGLTLYMRATGNALLSYKCSGSDAETQLLAEQGSAAQRELKAGTLTPYNFVLRVANAGELTVLETGDVWDKPGVVGQKWRPFERIHQSLSPVFLSADDAARYAHYQVGGKRDVAHFGYVLQRADGKFFATAPIAREQWKKDWGLPFAGGVSNKLIELPGYRYKAFYVARANTQAKIKTAQPTWSDDRIKLFTSMPGFQYIAAITSGRESIPTLYNSGPDGSLVKYVCSHSQEERNFSALLDSALKDGGEIGTQLDGFDGSAEQLVKKLVKLGELNVVISNPTWRGSRGKVPTTWIAYEPFLSASPVDPPFSWVFQDPGTTAQYAHDQMRLTSTVKQVAFILKSMQAEEYVVTDPVVIDSVQTSLPLFSPLHAFSVGDAGKPKLPEGYAIQGVCYLSLPDTRSSLKEKWLYECFVSPMDFALAIGTSRVAKPSDFALYISTRDGAQLRYVFSQSAQENQLYAVNPHGIVRDNGDQAELAAGTLTPAEFVKRVAAAGALSVVQTGRLWDVQGLVGQDWQPFALHPKPVLSPAFLTADDAARYAHERIGNQRDYGFSGYILQRQDQRFVVTEPLDNFKSGRFTLGYIYPADATGEAILPEHLVLHGMYASCQAFSLYDPDKMTRLSWTREQACIDSQMFSDVDIHTIIQNRHRVPLVYLSNAEDSLIAYDTSGSAVENTLFKQVAPGPKGSLMAQDLVSGVLKPEGIVKQLADAGGLRVVVGSELWGAPGMVPEHWKAFPAAKDHEVPEQVAYGAIFSSADAAAKDAHERVRRYGPDQTCFGFILKHKNKEEYIVSETVAASQKQKLFSLASLFPTDDTGDFEHPMDFDLIGLFYARQWMPKGLSSTESWLAQHFISSSDLYQAFFEARRRQLKDEPAGLPVYISTLDRALLRYQTVNSTTLFDAQIQPSGTAEDVHTQLVSGQLLPKDFVRKVITLSWLTVVVLNEFWGEQSPVRLSAKWKPYPDYARRALSPAFICQADAVRYVYQLLGSRRDSIYGGLVLKRADGLFVATEPLVVPSEDFDPKWILPDEDVAQTLLVPGCQTVARYRSRGLMEFPFLLPGLEKTVYCNMLSTEVISTALASDHLWTHEYLFGPEGSIVSFTLHDDGHDLLTASLKNELTARVTLLENQLAPSSDSPHDPWSNLIERRIRNGAGTPTEWVNQLVKAGDLHVVQSSNLWGPARKVIAAWQPQRLGYQAPESVRFATADRALSPAFCHMDDAVRYAHEHAGKRDQWTFGFILASSRLAHWVTSLPVTGDDLKFSFERVFLRGQLPTGYAVQGLYLCAPARQPEELPRNEVYRSFIPPSVLQVALAAVAVISSVAVPRFQPLYLSCADGALLKYEAVSGDNDLHDSDKMKAYVKTLQGDGNPAEYIRKVARAGDLSVLISSAIWATKGRVEQTWRPRDGSAPGLISNQRLALGPLCSHADDAARGVWRRFGTFQGKAYLGGILRNDTTSTFVAVEPLDDTGPSVAVGLRSSTAAYRRLFEGVMNMRFQTVSDKYPAGYKVMGVQQIYKLDEKRQPFSDRYEEALSRHFISQEEIRAFIEMFRTDNVSDAHYYFTPRNGALLSFVPSYQEDENDMLRNGWIDEKTGAVRFRPSEVITTLATSGKLYILEADTFWQPRSQVGSRLLLALKKRE